MTSRSTRSGCRSASHQATAVLPVVADNRCPRLTSGIDQSDHVIREFVHGIGCNTDRIIAQVVIAWVRWSDAKTGLSQNRNRVTPAVLEFREAVQQDDQTTMVALSLGDVGLDAIPGNELEAQVRRIKLAHRDELHEYHRRGIS